MAATRFLDVIPRFAVPDVAAAVAYYQDVLGFLLVNSLAMNLRGKLSVMNMSKAPCHSPIQML